jgi:hypothetical protein
MQPRRRWHHTATIVVALLLTLAVSRSAAADSITVMWDASPDPAVVGYVVYIGTQSGTYSQSSNVGAATSFVFSTAVPGQLYCFAVAAYAAGPVEGAKSTEACGYSDQRPTLTNPGSQTTGVGQSDTLQLVGADPDGLPVTYSATGLPAGMSLMASTGFISGSPTTAGSYSVTATVSDNVLTASQTFTWTVTAPDTTAPAVSITAPTSGTTYSTTSGTINVSGTASDNTAVTQVSWVNSRGGGGNATGTTSWSATGITLLSGSNVLTITAGDAAGNTQTDVLTVTYTPPDTTAPTVAITAPSSTSTYTTSVSSVTLGGTASDSVGVTQVSWVNNRGGSGTATGTTSWTTGAVTLSGGSNVLTITARDAVGNQATDVLTVTYNVPDTTAPVVSITAPTSSASYATSAASVNVSGTASDAFGVTQVSWTNDRGGSGNATGTTSWSISGVALLSGANILSITARDAAGNSSTDVLTVTYTPPDTTVPTVAITAPTSSATHTTTSGSLSMSGTASDNVGVTQVSWANNRGGSGNATGTASWNIAGISLQIGSNVLTITARDAAGNTATAVLTVTYNDATAPVISVTGPTSSTTYATSAASVNVSGTASDGIGVTQVSWTNDRGGSGNATGTTSWSISGVALLSGVNVLSITARDAAGNTATDVLTVTYTPLLTLTSLTPSQAAPQTTGTPVTFTAVAINGTAPYQYKWWLFDGANWTVLQAWSTSNTFTWTPTAANAAYRMAVWVRNAGSTADAYDNANSNTSIPYPVTASTPPPTPLSLTSLTANRTAPQQTGTAVTFTTAATGGTAPRQYKWLLSDGTSTSVLQAWSTSNTVTWTPSTANAAYQVSVWARNASSTADAAENANSIRSMAFAITSAPATTLTLTGLTPNVAAPRPAGTPVTFTATVSGGTAPHQYKWWLFDGAAWTVLQSWTTSSSFTWTPATPNPAYRFAVWVRNAASTADMYDNAASNGSVPFAVTAAAPTPPPSTPLSLTGLTANRTAPQQTGTPVTFTASGTGGTAPYQYKWLLSDGTSTSVLQAWSTSNTMTWTPATANGAYQVSVWARNASSTADAAENANSIRSMAFAITSAPPPATTLTLTSLTPNVAAPRPAGSPVTFTATVSGGTAPYQYKWWLFDGASWTVVGSWTTSNAFTWTPPSANPAYRFAVWVRNAASTADMYDNPLSNGSVPFVVTPAGATPPPPPPASALTLTSLTANRIAPQPTGTPVTFTATVSGGTAPQQYKWWLFNGSTWTILQAWSTSNTLTWTPTSTNSAYRIGVWVRNASSTADTYDNDGANGSLGFAIANGAPAPPGSPILLTGLNANRVSPQPTEMPITFTAVVTGGSGAYHYKWWVFDGATWTVVQNWTTSNTYTWLPMVPNANYRFAVWVRNASSTADAYDNPASNGSVGFIIR